MMLVKALPACNIMWAEVATVWKVSAITSIACLLLAKSLSVGISGETFRSFALAVNSLLLKHPLTEQVWVTQLLCMNDAGSAERKLTKPKGFRCYIQRSSWQEVQSHQPQPSCSCFKSTLESGNIDASVTRLEHGVLLCLSNALCF